MKKLITIILLLIGLTTIGSCSKNDTTWVYYDETKCIDKWGHSNVAEDEKKETLKIMLKVKE